MKKLIFLIVVLVFAAFILLAFINSKRPPIAHIKIVDVAGKPIAGVVIKPDGLRPKNNGGHYSWGKGSRFSVRSKEVVTDADGIGIVEYPRYVEEKLETSEISFSVDHPDYCTDRPFRVVSRSPPASAPIWQRLKFVLLTAVRQIPSKPDPVILKRGGILELSGYIDSPSQPVIDIYAQIDSAWAGEQSFWQSNRPGVLSSRRIQPGANLVRLIHFSSSGVTYFSEPKLFTATPGITNQFQLQLMPGLPLTGKLDSSVARPITNSRVLLQVYSGGDPSVRRPLTWHACEPVAEDGSFTFKSLPAGKLDVIGYCDGFVSADGMFHQSMRSPQRFVLAQPGTNIVLAMERTATCEFMVLDDQKKPISGAEVSFWPNVIWDNYGSTIFGGRCYNFEEIIRNKSNPFRSSGLDHSYTATTDARGIAIVTNLPAGSHGFNVGHVNFDMPIKSGRRSDDVKLGPSENAKITVVLERKGSQVLDHSK